MPIFWAEVRHFICPHCHNLRQRKVGLFGSDEKVHVWCDHCGKFTSMELTNKEEVFG